MKRANRKVTAADTNPGRPAEVWPFLSASHALLSPVMPTASCPPYTPVIPKHPAPIPAHGEYRTALRFPKASDDPIYGKPSCESSRFSVE